MKLIAGSGSVNRTLFSNKLSVHADISTVPVIIKICHLSHTEKKVGMHQISGLWADTGLAGHTAGQISGKISIRYIPKKRYRYLYFY
jgi:hypothetical protein